MLNLAPSSLKPELRRPNVEPRARFRSIKWPGEAEIEEQEIKPGSRKVAHPVFDPPIRILRIFERASFSGNLGVQVKLVGATVSDKALNSGTIGDGAFLSLTGIASEDVIVLQTENGINLTTE